MLYRMSSDQKMVRMRDTYERIVPALITSISQNTILTKNIIKMKYKQILVNNFVSNNKLDAMDYDYKLVCAVNTNEGIVYTFKRRNFFSRLFKRIF